MRRFPPTPGLAGRVALVLLGALLAVQAALVVLWIHERRDATRDLFERATLRRIVVTTRLLDAASDDGKRFALLAAVNSPTLRVRLSRAAPDLDPRFGPSRPREAIKRKLARALPGRDTRVSFAWGPPNRERSRRFWRHDHHERHDAERPRTPRGHRMPPLPDCDPAADGDCPAIDAGPDVLGGHMKAVIAVPLASGAWAVYEASVPDPAQAWLFRVVAWNLSAAVVAALFAYFAARRLTRPLSRFAEAADRLGRDLGASPLGESGAPEMRRATRAFNRMQARLQRFVADRTLMIAAISHDLRTMLTRLRLRAEFIADAEQRDKALADLDEMTAMLNATLSFAREDAADEPTDRVDLASLLGSLCDDLADAGQACVYAGPDSAVLTCRPGALKRAFANLIDNAIKYGGRADLELRDRTDHVVVTVADRGPGIPENRREEVFRPFFRLEASRSRETGGSGLGLALVRSIVRRHGGEIVLGDRPGGGLMVTVTLPR